MCKQKQMKPQTPSLAERKKIAYGLSIFSQIRKKRTRGQWWLAFVREPKPGMQEELELVSTWQTGWLSFMPSSFADLSSGIALCYVLQRVFQVWDFSCKFKTQLKFQCWNDYMCGMCSSHWCLPSNKIWFWLAEDLYHGSTLVLAIINISENYIYHIDLFCYAAMLASLMWQKLWLDFPNRVPWALLVRTTFFWNHQRHLWSHLNNPFPIALLLPKLLPRILPERLASLKIHAQSRISI